MAHKISRKLSFIGENIKKIRLAKNISQAEFASLFNLARPSVGAYEEGRSEPKIETLIKIANNYRISIDVLLTRELTVNEIFSFDLLNKKLNKAHQLEKGKEQSRKTPSIAYIGVNNYLEYIVNHRNHNFVRHLPEINIPLENDKERYRSFEMNGSEMEYHQQGIHRGDILIGQLIQLKDIKTVADKIIVVVHKNNIATRRLESVSDKDIVMITDDPNYPGMTVQLEEIIEIWWIQAVYSTYLNSPSLIEERVLKLENEVRLMKTDH